MAPLRCIWETRNICGEDFDHDKIYYIMTCCAVWAYARMFYSEENEGDDWSGEAYEMMNAYPHFLTVQYFLQRSGRMFAGAKITFAAPLHRAYYAECCCRIQYPHSLEPFY